MMTLNCVNRSFFTHSSSISKPGAYIAHSASQPLCDITGGSLSDYLQLPLEPRDFIFHAVVFHRPVDEIGCVAL